MLDNTMSGKFVAVFALWNCKVYNSKHTITCTITSYNLKSMTEMRRGREEAIEKDWYRRRAEDRGERWKREKVKEKEKDRKK